MYVLVILYNANITPFFATSACAKGMLFAKFGWNWSNGYWEYDFLKLSMYMLFCQIPSPFEKDEGHHFKKECIHFTHEHFVSSLLEIGPVVMEKISKYCHCTFTISLYSPLVIERFIWINLNSLYSRVFWLKFAQWFWLTKFLNTVLQCIFPYFLSSPLRKGRDHLFEQTWIPFNEECMLYASLVDNSSVKYN